MYFDSGALTLIMVLLDLIVLALLFRFKVINGMQLALIFVGNFIFIWYFNNIFPDIPITNHIPMIRIEEFESRGISEWIWLRYYFEAFNDSNILILFLQNSLIPSLSMLGTSFFYTLGVKWHQKIKWVLISGLLHSAVFIAFPLIENRIFDGLVYMVNMPFFYLGFIFYLIGHFACQLFLHLKKNI